MRLTAQFAGFQRFTIGIAALMLGTTLAGSAPLAVTPASATLSNSPSVSDIATGYRKFQKITERKVFVDANLAILCRGLTQQEMAMASLQHGPHANMGMLHWLR